MYRRLVALVGGLLFAASAQAAPIITINGGSDPALLIPGGAEQTITIGITPDANKMSGFNLIFQVSNSSHISLSSCSPAPGVQSSCPAGGTTFSFGAALGTDASSPFTVASFIVHPSGALAPGENITLSVASTVTDGSFNDVLVGPTPIAIVPEPTTAALIALGIGGLALSGRRRIE